MQYKFNAVTLAILVISLSACGHKDDASNSAKESASSSASATPSASVPLATDAADLTVDHKGNVVASAPTQTTVAATLAPIEALPFVGTREYNFDGGAQTVQHITIKSDGTVIIKEIHSDFGQNSKFVTSFKGKFTNPIQLKDGSGTGLSFKDGKVFRLVNGQPDTSCSDAQSGKDNISCSSELDNVN
ncbi:hypothetical protein [Aquirhabdus sp.]|uniref:hypothetical protein n=1 Tax=Aquirhabdus sp. TaxID=2824160 RepID=UPI00396CB627